MSKKVHKTKDDEALEHDMLAILTGKKSYQIAYVPGANDYIPSVLELERWGDHVNKQGDGWLVNYEHKRVETMLCHSNLRTGVLNRRGSIYFSC